MKFNFPLIITAVLITIFVPVLVKADITTGLQGYWKFDETTGTTATDSSGNGNTGTLVNGPIWTYGKINGGLSFDGGNDYVDLDAHISDYSSLSVGSISVWFKYTDISASHVIFSSSHSADASSDLSILYDLASTVIIFVVRENGTFSIWAEFPSAYNDGNWHNYVVTVNSLGNNHYIDGQSVTPTYNNGSSTTQAFFNSVNTLNTLRIGNRQHNAGNEYHFSGVIDEVRVYNRALSATDITELYEYTGEQPPAPANLLNCEYTDWDTEYGFTAFNCSSTAFELITDTNSTSTFWLDKKWDYGELLIAFILVFNLFFTIFLIVFSFFFEPVFKIRGKQ